MLNKSNPNASSVQIFKSSQFGEVRTVVIESEPWFVASDVCNILGLTNTTKAIQNLDIDERSNLLLGRQGNTNVINESGLYTLIIRSNKPEAKQFRKWVTSEILPAIRKTGGYIAAAAEETPEEIMARALLVAQSTLDRVKQQNQILQGELELQQKELKEAAPKVEYFDEVLQSQSLIAANVIAKELGMAAVTLNQKLHNAGVIYKSAGTWVLFHKYQGRGYTGTKTHEYTDNHNVKRTQVQTYWTEKGRAFIHQLFNPKTSECHEK